jgi:hypothetical protein
MDGALTTTADVAKQLDFGGGDPRAPHPPPAALDTPPVLSTLSAAAFPDDDGRMTGDKPAVCAIMMNFARPANLLTSVPALLANARLRTLLASDAWSEALLSLPGRLLAQTVACA